MSLHLPLASVPIVNDLQSRIAELTAEIGQQGPALAAAKQEMTRLQAMETDLSRTVQALRSEILALKTAHSADLAAVTAAGDAFRVERDAIVASREAMLAERDEALAARDAIQADRDDHITKYEDLEKRNYEETT